MLLMPLLLLSLTACEGDEYYEAKSGEAKVSALTSGNEVPYIGIVTPRAGEALPADAVEVTVETGGFIIDADAIGKAAVPGRGHWHLYVDGAFVQAHAGDRVTLTSLTPGPHHLRCSLANNDHSPLDPPVEDSVVVDVVGEGLSSPTSSSLEY